MEDFDSLIDYGELFSQYIEKASINGNELKGCCPFHDDSTPSFTVNINNSQWKCYGCDKQGNAQKFLEEYFNITSEEARKRLADYAGVDLKENNDASGKQQKKKKSFTIEDYAKAKRLPVDFLRDLGIKNSKSGITIPYYDESRAVFSNRQRYGDSDTGPKFAWSRGSKVCLYGLWRLSEVREQGYVFLVEGESDCHTLWYQGEPALGVPGATVFQPHWAELLDGVTLYVLQEPDMGGETFVKKVADALAKHKRDENDKAYIVKLLSAKDPSSLYIDNPDNFKEHIKRAVDMAEELDWSDYTEETNILEDAPVKLKQPPEWIINSEGVYTINEKTGLPTCVTPTPLIISKRLKCTETGTEKLEIAFRRDGEWQYGIFDRSSIFQARSITQLADLGVAVSSENARTLVRYLFSLEAENMENIPKKKTVSQLGWHGERFIPGYAGDYVVDVDRSTQKWLSAYHSQGTLNQWLSFMEPVLNGSYTARFMLASAFAAPLLRILGHRIFIIHNWGQTRAGKTAALKAAISAWGHPEELLASFYATRVGIERLASFFRDLPLGIDERQVSTQNKEFFDNLTYMLSLGSGMVRGTKTGGLQIQQSWKTIALTTGEEPLTRQMSHSGMHSRVLEVCDRPFEKEAEAQKFHNIECYGTAGPAFIGQVLKEDNQKIINLYNSLVDVLTPIMKYNIGSHVSAVASVCTADALIGEWFLEQSKEDAFDNALNLGFEISKLLTKESDIDLAERAFAFIKDWILSNYDQFTDESRSPRYGYVDRNFTSKYYVFPQILKEALERAGFSYKGTLQALATKGKIITPDDGERFTTLRRIGDQVARFVVIDLNETETEGDVDYIDYE